MADPLSMLKVGDPIPTSISVWNPILRAAMAYRDGKVKEKKSDATSPTGYVVCLAFNGTGANLARYKPAKVSAAGPYTVTSDGAASDWTLRPILTLDVPAAATDVIAVTLEAIPDGQYGRVAVAGWCACDVDISDAGHAYASPTTDTDALVSGATGSIRIIATGTGTSRRTQVYLGDQVAAGGGATLYQATLGSTFTLSAANGDFEDVTGLSFSLPQGTYFVHYALPAAYKTTNTGGYLQSVVEGTTATVGQCIACPTIVAAADVYGVLTNGVYLTLAGTETVKVRAKRVWSGGSVTTSQILVMNTRDANLTAIKIG